MLTSSRGLLLLGALLLNACAHLSVPDRVKDRAPNVTVLLDDVTVSNNLNPLQPAQWLRSQLRAHLEEAGFRVISDPSQPRDFEIKASANARFWTKETSWGVADGTLSFSKKDAVVVTVAGRAYEPLGGPIAYMHDLADVLLKNLFQADRFTDALEPFPPRSTRKPAATETMPTAQTGSKLVAVLPLFVRNQAMDDTARDTLEEAIRTVAADALSPQGYTVLTGENTLQVLSDNGVDPAKSCEASCALQAARELKAQLFVSGSIAREGNSYVVFIRLFSQTQGQQLASVQVEGSEPREIRRSFSAQAPEFFRRGLRTLEQ